MLIIFCFILLYFCPYHFKCQLSSDGYVSASSNFDTIFSLENFFFQVVVVTISPHQSFTPSLLHFPLDIKKKKTERMNKGKNYSPSTLGIEPETLRLVSKRSPHCSTYALKIRRGKFS